MNNVSLVLILFSTILLVLVFGVLITYLIYKNNNRKLQDEIKNQKVLPESRHDVNVNDLESTESGRKLLDIYRAPFKYLKDFSDPKPVDSKRKNVVLWGSVGSGKSWLIAALGASFYKYNSSDRLYTLQDMDGGDVVDPFTTPYRPMATYSPSSEYFQFARRFRNTSIAHRISSQAHSIVVWDTQGGAAESPEYSNEQNEILKSADYLILTLDHTRLNWEHGGRTEKEILSRVFSTWEANTPQSRPHVAVCLTKIDLLPLDLINQEPLEILQTVFGNEIYNIVVSNPNTQVFVTSSMGFIASNEGMKPNYDSPPTGSGELLDFAKWEPFGVEFPFFWLFEIRTQDSIGNNIFKKLLYKMFYIQYPKPLAKNAA